MAESFLFSIVESLIAKLASRAFEEASQVLGVYDHLKEFKETLSLVKAVLLDADQKQEHNHELQEWLRQIKRVFYDAEDLLDEFECETLRKQVVKAHGTTKDKVAHFFSNSNPLVIRYRMAQQIKDVSKRLDKVAADRHKFDLQIIHVDRRVVHRREMTHSHVTDSDVIGREHEKGEIIQLLMEQNPNDDHKSLSVIPIVGMGGLGKTTLAKFVFNDKRIDECFPLKMWVCVSDDFDIKQLIIKIINSSNDLAPANAPPLQQNLNTLDLEQLQNQLRNKLAGQRFLLVLDDVWNEDRVKWVELRNLIQVGAAGSKILVTTRSQIIASMMGTVPSHILEGLSPEDSLSLFVKWAFKEEEEKKYPHLVNIGREIVKRCDILPALKLSYDLMPSYLRQCFALFSLYPKDYDFTNFEVTSLWGALGLLISPKKNRTLEDVGNQYIYELLSRSFLQDFADGGNVYAFKIHDLVHDLALLVAKDECLHINSHFQNIPENVRHLSFAKNDLLDNLFKTKSVAMRTILIPDGTTGVYSETLVNTCVSKFKYLRFLDLSDSTCETLPYSIAKLKHLRYFNISYNQNIKRLPNSICKLQHLQVLKFDGCTKLEALPIGLKKMISLRHLAITTRQFVLPDNEIANLSSLAILNLEMLPEWLTSLTNLKIFGISYCLELSSLPDNFHHLTALEILEIEGCPALCRKCQPRVGEYWPKISHIKRLEIEELEEE
uniref:Disease resistance protein RGA2 n=1 Tax=Cajanus cajan TaxID=3821 RepID=A0A151TTZ7_CAJCA|nr:Disease resistance protein RGA2 [Cajanus cajan]